MPFWKILPLSIKFKILDLKIQIVRLQIFSLENQAFIQRHSFSERNQKLFLSYLDLNGWRGNPFCYFKIRKFENKRRLIIWIFKRIIEDDVVLLHWRSIIWAWELFFRRKKLIERVFIWSQFWRLSAHLESSLNKIETFLSQKIRKENN